MTLIPWLTGTIAGVPLLDDNGQTLRAQLAQSGPIRTNYITSHTQAADGTTYTQVQNIGSNGKPITIVFGPGMPPDLYTALQTAIEAALALGNDFAYDLVDSNGTYAGNASIAARPDWFDYPSQRANGVNIRNVTLYLIGKGI